MRGDACHFAHGDQELSSSPDLKKTAICEDWKRGECGLDTFQCPFAHGQDELRSSPAFADLKEKVHPIEATGSDTRDTRAPSIASSDLEFSQKTSSNSFSSAGASSKEDINHQAPKKQAGKGKPPLPDSNSDGPRAAKKGAGKHPTSTELSKGRTQGKSSEVQGRISQHQQAQSDLQQDHFYEHLEQSEHFFLDREQERILQEQHLLMQLRSQQKNAVMQQTIAMLKQQELLAQLAGLQSEQPTDASYVARILQQQQQQQYLADMLSVQQIQNYLPRQTMRSQALSSASWSNLLTSGTMRSRTANEFEPLHVPLPELGSGYASGIVSGPIEVSL